MSDSKRACEGGETIARRTCEHMEECQVCGVAVRFDLVDHPFFGFKQTCTAQKAPTTVDLESPEYRAYHQKMVTAIRAALVKRWPDTDAEAIERNMKFFDKQCTYEQEFADGVDPIEGADEQIEAAL